MNDKPVISHDPEFEFGAVGPIARRVGFLRAAPDVALGALAPLVGNWKGTGFNTIFRPLNPKFGTNLPKPPAPGDPALDNILELNLTVEKLSVTRIAGDIPNRGTIQEDISIAGLTYLQQINDTITRTGIHLEPGVWLVVPQASQPGQDVAVTRMASIPHGTTVNAQGKTFTFDGPPKIDPVDITPTLLASGTRVPFRSQTVANNDAARLPQDLTQLAAENRITQEMLDNPNSVLTNAIAKQNILKTTAIKVVTTNEPPAPSHGGGTTNIDFLVNDGEAADQPGNPQGPNANAVRMEATFWIESVEVKFVVPPHRRGMPAVHVPLPPHAGHPSPGISIDPGREVSKPTPITFHFTQIQYTQNVFLNFNGLRWPHVSVATLHPDFPIVVPHTAW